MNEKKRQIIETAIRFFAEKGYHATSIQEIVDELGIAKGSLYFYFKSKEDLLLSIYKYYIDLIIAQMFDLNDEAGLAPKERLAKKTVQHFQFFTEHRDFIKMQMQERAITANEEIEKLIFEFRAKILYWQHTQIIEIYGEKARPYALDGATLFGSMVQSYLGYILLDNKVMDFKELTTFIIDRLDDVIVGMIQKAKPPFLNIEMMQDFIEKGQHAPQLEQEILHEIQQIRMIASQLGSDSEREMNLVEEILSSIVIMEEEFQKEEPQQMIIKGMIAFLKGLKIPEIKRHIARIEEKI